MKVKEVIEKLQNCNVESEVYISPCACPGDTMNDIVSCGDIVEIE